MKLGRFELKRRENTVWDYVVPLGLVILHNIAYQTKLIYTSQAVSYALILIFSLFFLSRVQRILLPFVIVAITFPFGYLGTILENVDFFIIKKISTILIFPMGYSVVFLFLTFGFFLGNLTLVLISDERIKLPSWFRKPLGLVIYGFGLDFTFFYYAASGSEKSTFIAKYLGFPFTNLTFFPGYTGSFLILSLIIILGGYITRKLRQGGLAA